MTAFRAVIDHQLGTLLHLNSLSKVDDEAALGICADQKIFHLEVLLILCEQRLGLWDREHTL
jgi:hypothetical protein